MQEGGEMIEKRGRGEDKREREERWGKERNGSKETIEQSGREEL